MRIKTETSVGIFIIAAIGAFLYMSFHIGFFHVDKARYISYSAQFKDIVGLSKKAEVKIAGIKVGWVNSLELSSDGQMVIAKLMVLRKYKLYQNAQAIVRQEGILGSKYLELIPGSPDMPRIAPGSILTSRARESCSIDELLYSVKKVVGIIEDCNLSIKQALSKETFNALNKTAQNIANLSQKLDALITQNNGIINTITSDTKLLMQDLKKQLPNITENIKQVTDTVNLQLLPKASKSIDAFTNTLQTGVNAIAEINQIGQKINQGQGCLGKLLNQEELYAGLKKTVLCVHSSLNLLDRLSFAVDSHIESLHPLEKNFLNKNYFTPKDFKGYANFKIQPGEDYFFLAGLTSSHRGFIDRKITTFAPCPQFCQTACVKIIKDKQDSVALNLQAGKIINNFAFRFGIFEGTAGLALDCGIPLSGWYYKWVTSLEAFDLRGVNRFITDTRPHLKWLNKVFFGPNIYFAFGADDFISKYNKSAFLGIGVRFGNDYAKYPLSRAF